VLGAMRSHDAFFSVDTTPSPAQGFTEAAVRSYERGKRTPCYRFLCALQHAFGVDINQFLPQDERDLWEVQW
jgi:transcriptional regulator with XRE-family HTH domain